MEKILVTGFEPFNGETFNPSHECLALLKDYLPTEMTVTTATLPVDLVSLKTLLPTLLHQISPAIYIGLGLAPGRTAIAVERIGINVLDFSIPDNEGLQAIDEPIVVGGPTAYSTTLPIKRIVKASLGDNIPMYVSNTAGTYLCNAALYLGLNWAGTQFTGEKMPRVGFIHLPYATDYVPHPSRMAAIPLELMARAVALAISVARQESHDVKYQNGAVS